MMTKTERETIENIIARLKEPRAGCAEPMDKGESLTRGYEGISRLYINTWLIGPLELLLSDNNYDKKIARDMSRK